MISTNPYEQYRQTKIQTLDKPQLILLVYDGAIVYLKRAKQKMAERQIEEKSELLFKAQDVILELIGGLDMNIGGEVSKSLSRLYNYLVRTISEANIKNDAAKIDEVIDLLTELRQTWSEAILKMKNTAA